MLKKPFYCKEHKDNNLIFEDIKIVSEGLRFKIGQKIYKEFKV
jgi:hypothetical protein